MPTIPGHQTQHPCQYYFVKLAKNKTPIPGTMYSRNSLQVKHPCSEAWLPPYQMSRTAQCFHRNHIRYFYRLHGKSGTVVANSLVAVTGGKPIPACQLGETLLEYICKS